jgi:hypothetical protein
VFIAIVRELNELNAQKKKRIGVENLPYFISSTGAGGGGGKGTSCLMRQIQKIY